MTVPYGTRGDFFLEDCVDVNARSITNGQVLKYDATSRQYNASSDTVSIHSGKENVDVGGSYDATLGTDNVAVGVGACASVADGASKNTVVGAHGAAKLTTGDENVAVGDDSLGEMVVNSQNVAVGASAGANTLGGANTFVGYQAGQCMTNAGNVCVGHQVGADLLGIGNQAGSSCILIGSNAGAVASTNLTVIASDINVKVPQTLVANNTVVLGNTDVTSTHFFGGGLKITESSGDVSYATTAANTKQVFLTNNNVEGLAIEDAKVKFQTEIRFAGEHASVAAAGTPSIRTLAFVDNELAYYNGTEWRKVRSASF